jgi:PAS domain S-box-containing protein/putative nucleotidyltransferase with HDIG domain
LDLSVLFVEDSFDDVELMLRRLREAGIEPRWRRVEAEAELGAALDGEAWDVALVDFNLPGFSGIEALRALAERAPGLPAITVSGAITDETAVATITAGAVDYVLKDNLTRLAPAVRRAVEGADLRRQERRAAEQATRTQFAIDHSSQVIAYIAEDGTILYANAAAERLSEAASATIVGGSIWEWAPAVDTAGWAALWEATLAHPPVQLETSIIVAGGGERLIALTLDYPGAGSGDFVIAYARDITERKNAQAALRLSEAQLRTLLNTLPDLVWLKDPEGVYLSCNGRFESFFGATEAEIVGKTDYDFMDDDLAEFFRAHDRAATEAGRPTANEEEITFADDGHREILETIKTPIYATDGALIGVLGVGRDITARKRAETALWEREEQLSAILNGITANIAFVDRDLTILWANACAARSVGRSPAEMIGRTCHSLWADRDAPCEGCPTLKAFETGRSQHAVMHTPDGRIWESRAEPVVDSEGTLIGVVDIAEDITERVRKDAALRESEERFELFADHFPGYLFVDDEDLRCVYVNQRDRRDGEVLRADWLGKTPTETWDGPEAVAAQARLRRTLAGEVVDAVEQWRGSGRVQYLHGVYFPIPRPGRSPLVGGMEIDVTDQYLAQEEVRRQAEQLRRTVESAVLAMSHVVETRDPYTAGHERRVAELAVALAREMGRTGEEIEALRLAGLIHDIGKIAIPAEILAKPGRLSAVEFDLIRQHAAAGFEILSAIEFGRPVAEIVLQHHERLDGSGYPQGLSGEDILPEARILAVADVVEAMSSHRPYRAALGMEAALAEIREHAGVKYDAEVAAACARIVEEKGFQFTP